MSQLSVPFHARFSFLPVHSVPITYSGSPDHSRNSPPSSRDPSTLCAPPGHGIGSAVDAGNSVRLHSTPTGHDSVTRTSPVSQRPASRPHGPSLSAVLAGEGAAPVEPVLLPDRVVFRGQLVTEAQRPLQRLPVTGGRPLRAGVHHEGQQLRRATAGLQQTVGVLMSCLMTLLLLCGCGCASRNLRNVCHNWLYIQLQGNVSFALQKLSGRLY